MNKKISVVIRNRNEKDALSRVLFILREVYHQDISEIVVVDNLSTDGSVELAKSFGCKIVNIEDFTYGKAINEGIRVTKSDYILLLSSHAIPVGTEFFKTSLSALEMDDMAAGIRFTNGIENYLKAIRNKFVVRDPRTEGLIAACCIIKKKVWERFKFNEEILAIEDKEWSERVMLNGYRILSLNATYFYFLTRGEDGDLNRIKKEIISDFRLRGKKFPAPFILFASFIKKVFLTNIVAGLKGIRKDWKIFMMRLEIYKTLKK